MQFNRIGNKLGLVGLVGVALSVGSVVNYRMSAVLACDRRRVSRYAAADLRTGAGDGDRLPPGATARQGYPLREERRRHRQGGGVNSPVQGNV